MIVYIEDEEKCRRVGSSTGSSVETTPAPGSNETTPAPGSNETTPAPGSNDATPAPGSSEATPVPGSNKTTKPTGVITTNKPTMTQPTSRDPSTSDPLTNNQQIPPSDVLPDSEQVFDTAAPVMWVVQPKEVPSPVVGTPTSVAPPPQSPTTSAPPPTTPQTLPPTVLPTPDSHTAIFEHHPGYPDFITAAVIEYLNSVDGGPRWVEMVKAYLKLESGYPSRVSSVFCSPFPVAHRSYNQHIGRLSLRSRPQEVADWGHQRSSVPSITNVEQFQAKWIFWWKSCQPNGRSTATWPLSRDDAEALDWTRLNVTGPHGLFPVVMSTSWWASADPGPHRAVFDAAVTDLSWVIENLISFSSRSPESQLAAKLPTNKFPGHGERAPGKRKVKPSSKVSGSRQP
jgi:hypothetical protein